MPRLNAVAVSDLSALSTLKFIQGEASTRCSKLSSSDSPQPNSLIFVSKATELAQAIAAKASILILHYKLIPVEIPKSIAVFSTNSISEAMVSVFSLMAVPTSIEGIAKSAQIHSSARIGKNVKIGEFVVIEAEALVGDHSILAHHVVIEARAQVGANCFLHPHVVVGHDCLVGNDVEIHSHSSLGRDGFGYHTDQNGFHTKIPQLGITVIEDHVEIGSHCSIDRSTLSETRIGQNSKLDNFTHIAHNCQIGPKARLAGGFMIAGSSKIGANFLSGGGVLVTDHVEITDGVTLAGRSSVTNDIEKPGAYGGYPLEPLRDSLRTIANISKITSLRKQLAEVRKHLGLKE